MRFLTYNNLGNLHVTRDLAENDVPPYAVLSHTWGSDEDEVTFHEIGSASCQAKPGYLKIDFCAKQAHNDGLQHFWVDTCCIDKTNHVELSEAITSMYRWYQRAQVCYVYLADVSSSQGDGSAPVDDQSPRRSWELSFRHSRWFTRGWTLQELLAPRQVAFYSREGEFLGTKSELKFLLHEITGIPTGALDGCSPSQYSVSERLRWTRGRETKKKEDQAYCLLGIFNVFMPLNYGEGDHAFIRLTKKVNKTSRVTLPLKTAMGATFDSYGQIHRGCHPVTRIDLLQSVRDWARDVRGKSIFWLNGMAGTGKSTISWTIARWLADLGASETVALGASFFFKRGEGDRSSAALLFPSIASQLATNVNGFDVLLAQVIDADPQICDKSLGEQFNRLISEPLQRLGSDRGQLTYVIVVDALDECENEIDIRTVLQLWSRLPVINMVRLRLFLTSRPELVVRLSFKKMSTDAHHDMVLHEVPEPVIQHDIRVFLTDALAEVREEYNLEIVDEPLGNDWPGQEALQALTAIAIPLFIVATTIYRLIRDADQPQLCLETILTSRNSSHLSETGKIYMLVLNAMTRSLKDQQEISKVHDEFRTIVGSIVTLVEPLSRTSLAALLGITPSDIQIRLRSLHSVFEVPIDGDALIRPLHLSFGEYITGQEVQGTPYQVHTVDRHAYLWRRCLQSLSSSTGLQENICRLNHPGQFRSEIPAAQIDEHLRPEIRYACRYWVHHLWSSKSRVHDEDEVHVFLKRHFLHWLEVLSLTGRLADTIEFLRILRLSLTEENSSRVAAFLEDARRFVQAFRQAAEQAPLQLYPCSATFAPQTSIIKRVCSQLPPWVRQAPVSPLDWGLELEQLDGHHAEVNSLTFSLDGALLASSGGDGTVRLWEVRTGRELQKLAGLARTELKAVTFSHDGSLLASVGSDRVVRIWHVRTGLESQAPQASSITTVAFSPHDLVLASASWDMYVQLWTKKSGQEWRKWREFTTDGRVTALAFSPDGTQLASAGSHGSLQLWDLTRGVPIRSLTGYDSWVHAVAFSPGGSSLASAGSDGIVRFWDIATGRMLRRFKEHAHSVKAIAFSPDSLLLASAGEGSIVRLSDATTGQMIRRLHKHINTVNAVAFAPHDPVLASAGRDGIIRLWNLKMMQGEREELEYSPVHMVALSSDGSLLASVINGVLMTIWDVSTSSPVRDLQADGTSIKKIVFSPNRALVAVLGVVRLKLIVWIWDVTTGQQIQELEALEGEATLWMNMVFSPDASLLAFVFTADVKPMRILAWQVSTGQVVDKFSVEGEPEDMAFSHDGTSFGPFANPVTNFEKALGSGLQVNRDWIEHYGKKLLWLPHEYRYGCSSVSGNTVAIGRRDGIVSIFKIAYPLGDVGA